MKPDQQFSVFNQKMLNIRSYKACQCRYDQQCVWAREAYMDAKQVAKKIGGTWTV